MTNPDLFGGTGAELPSLNSLPRHGARLQYPEPFVALWSVWPYGAKKAAYKAFRKLVLSGMQPETLRGLVGRYVRAKEEPRIRETNGRAIHLSTLLNQERWDGMEDEREIRTSPIQPYEEPEDEGERVVFNLEEFRRLMENAPKERL